VSAPAAAGDVLLAHHPLLTALPFVIPAVIVVALVGAIIWRDRREDDSSG
jgi:hypothetical protein